jgi:hypothetical protein
MADYPTSLSPTPDYWTSDRIFDANRDGTLAEAAAQGGGSYTRFFGMTAIRGGVPADRVHWEEPGMPGTSHYGGGGVLSDVGIEYIETRPTV